MEPVDPESSRGGQGDAQGRLEALRQLATQSGVETSPKQVEAAPHMSRLPARRNFSGSRWRLWLAVTVMVALVAVVLVSILYRATPAPVVHTPRTPFGLIHEWTANDDERPLTRADVDSLFAGAYSP